MAGKKLNLDDFKNKGRVLTTTQQQSTMGGYKYIPSGAASTGLVDWTSIDIRNLERSTPSESKNLTLSKNRF